MTMSPDRIAVHLAIGFRSYRRAFQSVTRRANARFESRDWPSLRRDLLERIDAYGVAIDDTIASLEASGFSVEDRTAWRDARPVFRTEHAEDDFSEIAETFFNSVARKMFVTKGVDADLEFLGSAAPPANPDRRGVARVYQHEGDRRELLADLLRDCRFHSSWTDLNRDLDEGALRLPSGSGTVKVVDALFYRGQGAYLVGQFIGSEGTTPFALAIRHRRSGLRLAAVLVGEDDVSVLFSYTRAPFLVAVAVPADLVEFLSGLLPQRRRSEMYASIGFRKQAKTERYRDLADHLSRSTESFVFAPGIPGLVMIVFTLPGYDVVFKVIRDRFPPQKHVTPDEVAAKYQIVARHDRAGRLVEAQRFVDLRLPIDRFDQDLRDELVSEASRTVTDTGDEISIGTVYVERKVTPVDIYMRDAEPPEAERVIIDYGAAIKNLAASNIFPGDMLLKNFGVTRRGRVVFYDYDEIKNLTECTFRSFPESDDPYDHLSSTPAFGVGPNDVFPEELGRFLGLKGSVKQSFYDHHADLLDPEFWLAVQRRIESGETIEILPYRRSRSLEEA
ncbi:MAG: bifunctional isocitrate dehydrogenase kinase/phosphatase [Acidimicrobiia bacterium]